MPCCRRMSLLCARSQHRSVVGAGGPAAHNSVSSLGLSMGFIFAFRDVSVSLVVDAQRKDPGAFELHARTYAAGSG